MAVISRIECIGDGWWGRAVSRRWAKANIQKQMVDYVLCYQYRGVPDWHNTHFEFEMY